MGGWSGLTVFGEISDVPEENTLVISTSTGAEHVQLTPDTEVEIDLDEGRRVAADVARSGDALIAYSVRPIEDMD